MMCTFIVFIFSVLNVLQTTVLIAPDTQHTSVSVTCQQQDACYKKSTKAITSKCTRISAVPVLSSFPTGARVMSSSHPKFTGAASASTRAGPTFQSTVTRPVSTFGDSRPSSESGYSSCRSIISADSGYLSPSSKHVTIIPTPANMGYFSTSSSRLAFEGNTCECNWRLVYIINFADNAS